MADLQHILRDLLLRSSLTAAQIDVSQVSGKVQGVNLGERTPIHTAVSQLQQFFQLEAVENSGVLHFFPRGQQATATVLETATIEGVRVERAAELSLPQQLDVVHLDPQADYQASVQTALRQTGFSQNKQSLKSVISLEADVASQQAQTLLNTTWVERYRLQFSLPIQFIALQPGDVIEVVLNSGKHFTVRLLKVLFQENKLDIEAVSTQASIYEQPNNGSSGNTISSVQLSGDSQLYLLDIPLVNDNSTAPVYYQAVTKQPNNNVLQYATIFESVGEPENFTATTVLALNAIAGRACSVLGAPISTVYQDNVNSVEVILDDGQLQSITKAALLNGANAAVLGTEIIQFQYATLIGDRRYRLSGLLRGRRGTQWSVNAHSQNEHFVLLGEEVVQAPLTVDQLNTERSFKAVSSGNTVEDADTVTLTPTGVNLKPYAPVHLSAQYIENDLLLKWIRCSRLNNGWADEVDVPLAEESELYDIEIYHQNSLQRTFSSTEPQTIYTATQQIADLGDLVTNADTVEALIYQRSAVIGRGYGATLILRD